jgi:hypothetical protein
MQSNMMLETRLQEPVTNTGSEALFSLTVRQRVPILLLKPLMLPPHFPAITFHESSNNPFSSTRSFSRTGPLAATRMTA